MNSNSILSTLKVRDFENDISDSIKNFENELGIELPRLYKCFCETFQLGENYSIGESYYDAKFEHGIDAISRLSDFNPLPNIMPQLDQIFDLDTIRVVLKNYINDGTYDPESESSLIDKSLLPIIKHDNAMLITAGYGVDNHDMIFLHNTDKDEDDGRFIKLANNVFHYLRGLVIYDDPDQKDLYSNLHKKWNEEFWRKLQDK